MNTSKYYVLIRLVLVFVFMGVLASPASRASADGAVTFTQTFHNVTETFIDVLPCVGLAEITITYNGVVHVTENNNGTHFTLTQTGTLVAEVEGDPASPYTGKFTLWPGENINNNGAIAATFTFTVHARGSDGSVIKFHDTAHLTINANGGTLFFDKPRCG